MYKLKISRLYTLLNANLVWWGILAIAFVLRFSNLGELSLRLDETQSIWQASHSLEFIRLYMLKNVHLPLHNSLLHAWMLFFGGGEASVRVMSAIPGFLAVPTLYFLSREVIGRWSSHLTMLLGALSPIWVWYSREIRMYSLLTLITTLSYLFFVRISKYNRFIDYLAFTLVNIIGVYTHYFFLLVLFVQVVFFMVTPFGKIAAQRNGTTYNKKKYLVFLGIGATIVFAAFLPWLIMLAKSYGSGTLAPILTKPTTFNIILSYFEFTHGFLPETITSLAISLWPLIILFGFIFLTKRQNPFSPEVLLVMLGAFVPVLIIYLISVFIKPMYLTRYLIVVTPPYYILLTWYLSELRGSIRFSTIAVFVGLLCVSLHIQATHPDNPVREGYREAANYLNKAATPRDIIIMAPPYTIYPINYYYNGTAKLATIPVWNKRRGGIPDYNEERVSTDAKSLQDYHVRMFLVLTTNLENSDKIKTYFDTHYTKLEKHQFSQNIWVEVYQAEYE